MDKNVSFNKSRHPLVLSMNNKNRDFYFDRINTVLERHNFILVTNFGTGWDNFLFNTINVEVSFNQLKKILVQNLSELEFQINTFSLNKIPKTEMVLTLNNQNDSLFETFEIWCPFKKLD